MSSTIVCKSCKRLVVQTPTKVCANKSCQAQNWGYDATVLQNNTTLKNSAHLLICANCLTLVAKTPNNTCVSCHVPNWGYSDTQLINPVDLIQVGEDVTKISHKRKNNPNSAASTAIKPIVIEAKNITKVVNNGEKVILQPMSLSIAEGDFVALMGPSGSGKTTLLKCLNAVSPSTDGEVLIKGEDVVDNYGKLKRSIGYVPQEDIVHGELSVQQTLFYAAKLRMPDTTSNQEIRERITEVLISLNIDDDKIRANKVKDLSGGQRKRVSIAVELLNKPTILFLDEPTSPLDPETIEEFLKCIRDLALKNGTTIIMVTHKPDDLNYVDKVVFLGAKGYLLYYGDTKNFLSYFGKKSIIQIYALFGKDEDVIQDWANKWEQNPATINRSKKNKAIKVDRKENPITQWFWLTLRYGHIKINNIINIIWLLVQPLFVAIMLGFIFQKLEISIVFLTVISAIWFGVNNSATQIVEELPIYQRERMFNLMIIPYLFSKLVILAIIGFIQVFLFLGYVKMKYMNSGEGLVELNNFGQAVFFVFIVYLAAILLGLLFSSAINNKETVLTIMPLSLIPQIVFAGVIAGLSDQFKAIVSYAWLGRWGTQGLAHIQDSVVYTRKVPVISTDTTKIGTLESKDTVLHALEQLRLYDYLEKGEKAASTTTYDLNATYLSITLMIIVSFSLITFFLQRKDSIQIKGK